MTRSVLAFSRIVGVAHVQALKRLKKGGNPADYYRDRLLAAGLSPFDTAEWSRFFREKYKLAAYTDKAGFTSTSPKSALTRVKKRNRSIPIKSPLNLDLTPEQTEQIVKFSFAKRSRINFLLNTLTLTQNAGVLDAGASNDTLRKIIKSECEKFDTKLSIIQYKKIVKNIRENGLQNLISGWQAKGASSTGERKINVEDAQFFATLLANDNCLSQNMAWKLTFGKAIDEGRISAENAAFPCAQSFVNWTKKHYGDEAIYRIRRGKDSHTRNHAAYVSKTAENLRPNQVLVGDCMDFDVFVKVPEARFYEFGATANAADKQLGYKEMRVKLTAWMDYKTHRITGYKIHSEAQNTDHVLLSLKESISHFGSPQYLLIDNGKPYANKELGTSGKKRRAASKFGIDLSEQERQRIVGILTQMCIYTRFCLPFNSDGKPLERMFGIIHQEFDKLFLGQYAGVTKLRRPESTDETINKGKNHDKMLTLEEFESIVENYITNVYNKRIFASGERAGKSPLHIWNEEYDGAQYKHYSDEHLALMLSRETKTYTVRRHEITHSAFGKTYQDFNLAEGQKVYLRIDPADKDVAYCYDEKDRFVCAAKAKTVAHAFATTPEEYAQVSLAIATANQNNKAHKESVSAVKKLAKTYDNSAEKLLAYQEKYTRHAAVAAKLNHAEKTQKKIYENTRFADDLQTAKKQEREGLTVLDFATIKDLENASRTPQIFFADEADKIEYERMKKLNSEYENLIGGKVG